MGFLARIIRVLLWLVMLWWAVWLGRRLFRALFQPPAPKDARAGPPHAARPLYRDPQCGTYVAAEISHSVEQAGQVLHFCSAECRDRYLASQRRAASG